MKVLHTADWHVGRTIRGRSRAEEHRAALAQIAEVARDRAVDVAVVAGDQFDVQAPSPEAEQIVWSALQALAEVAPVVVVAGNHDNPRRLDAVRNLLTANQVHAVGQVQRPQDGGVVRIETGSESVAVAMLPFLHHRSAVRAADLLDPQRGDAEYGASYNDLFARYSHGLCRDLGDDELSILVSHVTCFGGARGGGEREAHSIERYCVDPRAFPGQLDYVALGHLHLAQQVGSAPPVHYSGAPLMMDFGESDKPCSVNLVELRAGRPASVEVVPVTTGRPLRTLRGTLDEVMELPAPDDEPWLRVLLSGAVPAGVAETVRGHLGEGVVDVRLESREEAQAVTGGERLGTPPQELFGRFLAEQQVADERVPALFAELIDEEFQQSGEDPTGSETDGSAGATGGGEVRASA
ncbi:exonuclease SbcCD subunit D [Euzebya tangerina]|uniref:exonuclease SbcCD subunit D n=1 Tax=Euzebya tangerina TaxID=591198 RepID=UPI000E317948|nr:exonuclease SbcCD subunit D [Euzebya tangerina]